MTLRALGGEMLLWSDLDGTHGPGPVRGPVLERLMVAATGRTLVVGPHHPGLIDALPVTDLTLLVRGMPDAESLAARFADRPGVTVCCGSPEKLAAEPPFDTIVALDGLERLGSVEGAVLTWADTFELLRNALRPGGRLLLAAPNAIGLHRLVALRDAVTDADWAGPVEADPTRPAGCAATRALLADAGLELELAYACYPAPATPTALLGSRLLADAAVHGFLAAVLGEACQPTQDVLSDPAELAVRALRHGLAGELAPAEILLCRRGAEAAGTAPAVDLPAAVVAAGADRYDVRCQDGRWVRDGSGGTEPVPVGRTLRELLLDACRRADLPAVRGLAVGWQGGGCAGVPADRVVVGPDGGLTALVAAGTPAAALLAFAAQLRGGGFPHPWPDAADDVELAVTVAALAGRPLDPAAVAGAATTAAPRRPDEWAFRQLAAARDRLADELARATAQIRWYERTLTERQDALRQARRTVELLSDTGPARFGSALVGGVRVARRAARASVRRLTARS